MKSLALLITGFAIGILSYSSFQKINTNLESMMGVDKIEKPSLIKKFKNKASDFENKHQLCQEEIILLKQEMDSVREYSGLSLEQQKELSKLNQKKIIAQEILLEDLFQENYWDDIKEIDYQLHKSIVQKMTNIQEQNNEILNLKRENKDLQSAKANLEEKYTFELERNKELEENSK